MAKYKYIKKYPFLFLGKTPRFFFKLFSFIFCFMGLVLIGNAAAPIISYQLNLSPQFQGVEILSPLNPDSGITDISLFSQVLGEQGGDDGLIDIKNWFPAAPFPSPGKEEISNYNLSIPSLRIFDALVKVGVEDLNNNLAQYPGTGIPGRLGNVVIFGHSVLAQFFNPKNYKTIFSTLPTFKKGEEILLDYDGIRYTYWVEELNEVPPNDVSILAQKFDDSYVTLVTCVPPGTYLKRLVVRARLAK